MTAPLTAHAKNIGPGTFTIEAGSQHSIILSSPDDNQGPSPMETLLSALASCTGIGVLSILRKMRQDVTSYEIKVHGERADEQPRLFTHITVEHIFTGTNLRPESIQRAITLDTTQFCGVNITLAKSASITHTFQILETEESATLPAEH